MTRSVQIQMFGEKKLIERTTIITTPTAPQKWDLSQEVKSQSYPLPFHHLLFFFIIIKHIISHHLNQIKYNNNFEICVSPLLCFMIYDKYF